MPSTYITRQGETWDQISLALWGSEYYADQLIRANVPHRKAVIFSAGISLIVPDIDLNDNAAAANLPPWLQEG